MTIYGSRTVREGSRVAIWSRSGKVKIVDGPARVTLVLQRCVPLRQHFANQSQYLVVRKRAGPVVIRPGPCTVFFDPVEDEAISVEHAVQIDASQALVVYRNVHAAERDGVKAVDGVGGARGVDRRVVRGPARFIPTADEWCHDFSWSGVPKDASKTTVQPNANKFTKLSVIPSSMYHNVSEVRTNDDTLITVKLMIFFQLDSIERMLACTTDPIADFVNAASADVIAFCSGLNYENFLTLTGELNKLETFSQLTTRAEMIGYTISKVVFRGFQAGEKLQAMHDGAIQERTRLRLLEETQEQQQRAEDMKLEGDRRRAKMQAELEMEQHSLKTELSLTAQQASIKEEKLSQAAKTELAALQHEADLRQQKAEAAVDMEVKEQQLALEQRRNEEQLRMMREMKAVGVDLTKVLVSQHEQPDKILKIDTGDSRRTDAQKKGLLGALQLNL